MLQAYILRADFSGVWSLQVETMNEHKADCFWAVPYAVCGWDSICDSQKEQLDCRDLFLLSH